MRKLLQISCAVVGLGFIIGLGGCLNADQKMFGMSEADWDLVTTSLTHTWQCEELALDEESKQVTFQGPGSGDGLIVFVKVAGAELHRSPVIELPPPMLVKLESWQVITPKEDQDNGEEIARAQPARRSTTTVFTFNIQGLPQEGAIGTLRWKTEAPSAGEDHP